MTMTLDAIRVGWKVFARSDEVGTVENVDHGEVVVRSGHLIRHRYRVPAEYVASAGDGVVDLELDSDSVEQFEASR